MDRIGVMVRVMRKAIYESSEAEGRALFARAPSVHIATTSADGRPILRAVHGILDGDVLAFHGAPAGEKMAGLGRRAVVTTHETVAEIPSWFLDPERACPATTYYVSAQIDGVLEEITDPARKAAILQTMMTNYQPEGRHVPIREDDPLYGKAVRGLLVAGVTIESLSCKAKLGQNRRPEERRTVLEKLWSRGGPRDVNAIDLLVRRYPELEPPFLHRPGLVLSCVVQPDELDDVLGLLADAYWLAGMSPEQTRGSILASQAVVLAHDARSGALVGFARAVSDGKVAWIYDVIVASSARGANVGTALMTLLLDHPALRDAWQVNLGTRDAMGFYGRFGFDVYATSRSPRGYVTSAMRLTRS